MCNKRDRPSIYANTLTDTIMLELILQVEGELRTIWPQYWAILLKNIFQPAPSNRKTNTGAILVLQVDNMAPE